MTFNELHQQDEPLIICNVWDAASAKVAEKLGFQAIGTSSAAIASLLGYEDGESMSFEELSYLVKRIVANTSLPLTVDLESGYSRDPSEVVRHINILSEAGVVGVNIEDSIVDGERKLINSNDFATLISSIKKKLKEDNQDIFLNVRIDTFLMGVSSSLMETEKRVKLYTDAGADGIFVPCIEKENDIKILVEKSTLPINVMCMPNLPNFKKLKELGVKRISMGNFLFDNIVNNLKFNLNSIMSNQSFETIFQNASD